MSTRNSKASRVAIILPTLHCDSMLDQAVESLLLQTFKSIEVHVCFDGTAQIDSRPWMSDPRVVLHRSDSRRGLAVTLTEAIRRTDAEYIARLDADDISEVNRFETQVDYMDRNRDVVLCASMAQRIDIDGNALGPFPTTPASDARNELLTRNVVVHSSVLFRRRDYDISGGFDPQMKQMEDYDLWLRMATRGRISILPDDLVRYRIHPGQVSRGAKPYGYYIRRVLKERGNLSRHLRVPGALRLFRNMKWLAAQTLRYYGIRRPGYDKSS